MCRAPSPSRNGSSVLADKGSSATTPSGANGRSIPKAWTGADMALDAELLQIIALSFLVAGTSTLVGSVIGLPLGALIALKEFRGRDFVRTLAFTFYGFPPVLAGLLVFLLLSKEGPLGFLEWLFTPIGMVVAQVLIVTPIVTGITASAVMSVEKRLHETALALGADGRQWRATALPEARAGLLTAVMLGV